MKTALILIDFQRDYFAGGRMELVNPEKAAERAGQLLYRFRELGLPVVFIQHISVRPEAGFFLPGTDGIALHGVPMPLSSETVFEKHYPNSFRQTGLEQYLRRQNVNQLVLCGMMTHMCVDATVRAAFDLGFNCILPHDACATRGLEFNGQKINAETVHATFMASLGAVYAQVVSTDDYGQVLGQLVE